MNRVLRAELRKLRSARSLLAIPVTAVAISAVAATVLVTSFKPADIASRLSAHGPLRFGPTNVGLFLLLFGVRLFTDETHHRTLGSTYLAIPRRRAVLAAKAVVAAVTAVVTTAAIYALVLPVTLVAVHQRHLAMTLDVGNTALLGVRVVAAMTLMTLLGLAAGAAIANRTVALVTCVAWLALAEDLLGALLHVARFLPAALAWGLVDGRADGTLGALLAALLLTAWTAAFAAAAVVALGRDVP